MYINLKIEKYLDNHFFLNGHEYKKKQNFITYPFNLYDIKLKIRT